MQCTLFVSVSWFSINKTVSFSLCGKSHIHYRTSLIRTRSSSYAYNNDNHKNKFAHSILCMLNPSTKLLNN